MDFHDLGKHCSADNCGQQDFLPFKCNACQRVYCLDHRTYTAHSCTNANFKEKRVLECPSCSKVLKRPIGVAHDILLQRHLASGCVEGVRKPKLNKLACSAAGCRGSEFVKVSCKSCRKNFCFRHRHEDDHKCEVSAAKSMPRQPGTGVSTVLGRNQKSAGGVSAGAGAGGRGCGTEAGAAAQRREKNARARGAATGITAR